ncbi:Outer membrane receptor proteins, mostly Fe transport [Flavobacterium fontis]|uniref:Outer membrane receptor proteins, mostly Fe transport n=1 Tax=Flavobacterium fontis TaxID=1124188 RepID=A0A1M5BH09_9FLAO|nr:outer membrane beta-barrel family protein [Flavobacterium fontis]SHF41706.1 Outer membrane receptor proteins, mostly Fe transport [Flavobacterium fontis]
MRIKSFLLLIMLLVSVANLRGQNKSVTVSGITKDKATKLALPFVNVSLKSSADATLITVTITNEEGRFSLSTNKSGNYILEFSYIGYKTKTQSVYVGSLSEFLDQGTIELEEDATTLQEVVVVSKTNTVSDKMDKKTFSMADNISQSGGSVLQSMQNLPGVTVQDGKVQIRGNDKVTVLIDGKQTALTGFGNQSGLDNIPASAIEKIEIINNPSAKYDANGNAGIINIIYKKNKKEGFNGKVGITSGLGALWERKENLPTIRPQYTLTPKINPTLSLNYRKNKINAFFQGDYLYTETLNKNEFVTRTYNDGTIINQQLKRNRNTHFTTIKSGIDWTIDDYNTLTVSGLFGSEKIIDNGDQPFFNSDYSERLRLWQFLEDELKTTVMGTAIYQHKFKQAGHLFNVGFNYTFHREDEKYFFDNILPSSSSKDSFKLLSDESVVDINIDYIKPLKYGRIETGLKFRNRIIPTNMQFFPGNNSPIDASAGGKATYEEIIPAVYGNYIYETNKIEAEIGLRLEYLDLEYEVNPNHPTYRTDGYSYFEPFPNFRFSYKINNDNKISLFYNRRIDRPNEVDIRIFPKYDDAEIIKVGNPALRPQFTNLVELGFKRNLKKGYLYSAIYHRFANATITRIASTVPSSNLIYAIFQNVNKSSNTGVEMVISQDIANWYSSNLNLNAYYNQIGAFTVQNLYPEPNTFSAAKQDVLSGNIKWNNTLHLTKKVDAQLTAIYLAPDIIPQGKIKSRFSIDLGLKKSVQNGKGEFFINATDLLNTLVIKKEIQGQDFSYTSNDYYETQVIRAGYNYKF